MYMHIKQWHVGICSGVGMSRHRGGGPAAGGPTKYRGDRSAVVSLSRHRGGVPRSRFN